jgi:lipopolysaccharide export system protein LptA
MVCLWVPLLVAQAAENGEGSRKPQEPVDIRSDHLVVDQKKRLAVFAGNVRCVQGELVIECEKLTVEYAQAGEGESEAGRILKMLFSGNVSIQQKNRKGHCKLAEYDRIREHIVCTGDPWVVENKNRIRGDRIEYLLEQDEVRVTRPRAVLHLEEKQKLDRGTRK